MPVIAVPRILREKLGEDGIDSLVDLFNKSEQKVKEDVIAISAEKFERRLSEEISGVRSDLLILEGKFETRITKEISQVRQELSQVRQELSQVRQEISQVKQELSQVRQELSQVRQELTNLEARIDKRITEEISQVRQEINELRQDLTSLEARIDKRIAEEISQVRQELTSETSKIRVEISLFKSEIIKWMFLFWIGQLACVAGIVNWLK